MPLLIYFYFLKQFTEKEKRCSSDIQYRLYVIHAISSENDREFEVEARLSKLGIFEMSADRTNITLHERRCSMCAQRKCCLALSLAVSAKSQSKCERAIKHLMPSKAKESHVSKNRTLCDRKPVCVPRTRLGSTSSHHPFCGIPTLVCVRRSSSNDEILV